MLVTLSNQINHSGDITSKEPCWEIKGKGFLGRDVVFSLRTPLEVKSGEQVRMNFPYLVI
jgi:[ribulose-bisphosphate carboxylase]-lysine N-methyltransferase